MRSASLTEVLDRKSKDLFDLLRVRDGFSHHDAIALRKIARVVDVANALHIPGCWRLLHHSSWDEVILSGRLQSSLSSATGWEERKERFSHRVSLHWIDDARGSCESGPVEQRSVIDDEIFIPAFMTPAFEVQLVLMNRKRNVAIFLQDKPRAERWLRPQLETTGIETQIEIA